MLGTGIGFGAGCEVGYQAVRSLTGKRLTVIIVYLFGKSLINKHNNHKKKYRERI